MFGSPAQKNRIPITFAASVSRSSSSKSSTCVSFVEEVKKPKKWLCHMNLKKKKKHVFFGDETILKKDWKRWERSKVKPCQASNYKNWASGKVATQIQLLEVVSLTGQAETVKGARVTSQIVSPRKTNCRRCLFNI